MAVARTPLITVPRPGRTPGIRRLLGFAVALYSLLILNVGHLHGATFLMGVSYGLILIADWRSPSPGRTGSQVICRYGTMMFGSGMLLELLAYATQLDDIRAGRDVHLFSPHLVADLLIGMPQYAAGAAVWSWFLRRYDLSPGRHALTLFIFWAATIDNFSHVPALLSGNVVDFVNAGLVVVFALNWPLVVLAKQIEEAFPARRGGWTALTMAFAIQMIPLLVSVAVFLILALFDAQVVALRG